VRRVDGVLSYTQAFCHRQIDNLLLRKYINLPFLAVEGDRPGPVDARTALRLESFLDMLR
jgi:benzoyl-CoA reductase/2-hydroxyglutaryl-CoA dehydratase subunit BcrC/BadD/HgdB